MPEPSPEQTKAVPKLDAALRKKFATVGDVYEMLMSAVGEVGKSMTERLGRQQSKMVAELMTLRARVKELEQRPALEDAGVWTDEKQFKPGNVCSYDGSAWVARAANKNARPGQSDAWRLMVKRGRDGKDTSR